MSNIVVIGASAGGVQALRKIISPLPADLNAAIFVVVHISPMAPSLLPEILNLGALPAAAAYDGERIRPARIYVAPPDHHMLIDGGFLRLTRGPKENRFRPAIDPLFRTAARAYGNRVLGIVLTGLLGDGAVGLQTIKSLGGMVVVQDPKEALFDEMPLTAIRSVDVDFILPTAEIPAKIVELARERWKEAAVPLPSTATALEEGVVKKEDERYLGEPSAYTCPDCNGTLWELDRDGVLSFRCRIGHAYSADGVRAGYSESVEAALWAAVRALEESAALERELAEQARNRGNESIAARFHDVADGREQQSQIIRDMLLANEKPRS